jgi:hypothetical protein
VPSQPNTLAVTANVLAVNVPGTRRVYFDIDHPRSGAWKVVPLPGAPEPTSVQVARPYVSPATHVTVKRHGRRDRLTWRLRAQPGQSVRFLQSARTVYANIANTTKPHGSALFAPAPSPGGRRQIVAVISVGGLPRKTNVVVGHYTAPRPFMPSARDARYRLHGSKLSVSWKPARARVSYEVKLMFKSRLTLPVLASSRAAITLDVPTGRPQRAQGRDPHHRPRTHHRYHHRQARNGPQTQTAQVTQAQALTTGPERAREGRDGEPRRWRLPTEDATVVLAA